MIRSKQVAGSIALILLGAGYLAYNTAYSLDTWSNPGPAVFPLLVGGVLVILAFCDLIHTLRSGTGQKGRKGGGTNPGWSRISLRGSGEAKIVLLVLLFIIYLVMIRVAGFFISNFLFVSLSSRLMGAKDWARPCALAAGICLFCYLLFEMWLKMSLPRGFLM